MKRYITVLAVGILLMFSKSAYSQVDQYTIMRVISEILEKGIAFDEPRASFTYLDDFFAFDSADGNKGGSWVATQGGATSVISFPDTVGGIIKLTVGTTTKNGWNLQHRTEFVKFEQGKDFKFSARISVESNDSNFFFIGFSVTDDSLMDGSTDMFGFLKEAGDSLIYAVNTKNSVGDTTSMGYTLTDATANKPIDLSISFSDSSIWTYRVERGSTIAQVSHTTPSLMPTDTELTPTIAIRNGNATAGAIAHILRVDWFFLRRAR